MELFERCAATRLVGTERTRGPGRQDQAQSDRPQPRPAGRAGWAVDGRARVGLAGLTPLGRGPTSG